MGYIFRFDNYHYYFFRKYTGIYLLSVLNMKTFLKNILLLFSVILLLFFGLDFIVTKGLRHSNSEINGTFNKVLQGSINADLIINGSSKALVQVSPKILDSILEMDTYNIGMDGAPFLPQNLQFNL